MPKISIFLVHQKQPYLEDIQTTVLKITEKNGGISFQLASLKIKRELALLCNQLILGTKPVDKNIFYENQKWWSNTCIEPEQVYLYSLNRGHTPQFALPMKLLPCTPHHLEHLLLTFSQRVTCLSVRKKGIAWRWNLIFCNTSGTDNSIKVI